MADTPRLIETERRAGFAETLARRRVPLGFVVAVLTVVLARPTLTSLYAGMVVAIAGEMIRVWAAGHLEKGKEVTRSGPYRWVQHPLYIGSSIVAVGVAIACRSLIAATLIVIYMAATLTAAVRSEEAFLRRQFGETYERYRRSLAEPPTRRFSASRAIRNREHKAIAGLVAGFALLAAKFALQ
jgi:protein-S-isoprenylcysteine O-methyltransferase Ste14